jgi:glucoamylase
MRDDLDRPTDGQDAPGAPGIEPRWTSSDKSGVGTALSPLSRIWFTLSHGILNEIYYPRVDQACIRDFGFIVTDGTAGGLFAEEKRDMESQVAPLDDGVPFFHFLNTYRSGGFRIRKRVVTDVRREVVLQKVRLETLNGGGGRPLRLFALLAPHLVNRGAHNTGWLGKYKGVAMLFAEGSGTALALACSTGWSARSVGFAGTSDGWQLLHRDGQLTEYQRAADGNVALTGELALPASGEAVLALGFGRTAAEAAYRARASLFDDFDETAERYAHAWRTWQKRLRPLDRLSADGRNSYRVSTAVLRTHDSPSFPGGLIASLSIPWGASKGDDDLGGYHLVWPRDLVQTAGALLAAGAADEAIAVLDYLRAIQDADGRWPQNAWLDGTPYWTGVQMDECIFPVLLADLALREGVLTRERVAAYWPMVRKAVGFVVGQGPATGQDRWEENSGYSPFTLAAEIAGLLAAADLAECCGEPHLAPFLRDTADAWVAMLDEWIWAGSDAPLAREAGVPGYYVRITPALPPSAATRLDATVPIRNRPAGQDTIAAWAMVSPDALALVRFGLRRADDPRMVATMRVLDHVLKRDMQAGPYWYRYNGDGYGEHPDGAPYDGTGQGRLWPLLTGERAHVALAGGDRAEAARLLATMEAGSSMGDLLPEQIWDTDPIPERELEPGRPSGSAMPLVWAHAEHIKLLRSLADGQVFDMPPQTRERYLEQPNHPRVQVWRPDFRTERLASGRALRLDLRQPATVYWSADGGATWGRTATLDTGLGLHAAELAVEHLKPGTELRFRWAEGGEEARVAVI